MRLAVLVKQIPNFEEMELGPDGRLKRDGIDLEMNPYCRRAVSQAVALAADRPGSTVTVITLGPPAAEDTLREAIAWGLERDVDITGVLVTDPAFAGSDTLATAKALAATLARRGPFDLVLAGRNSVDADTGQVGPEVAELLDLPFMTGVRHLALDDQRLTVRCEHDDGWLDAELALPAVISCAERLIDPCKVDPAGRAAVPAERISRLTAADLGPGPWGQDASPTWVGPVTVMAVSRARQRWPELTVDEQITRAVPILTERGALTHDEQRATAVEVPACAFGARQIVVIAEPDRLHATRELIGAAAGFDGCVVVFTVQPPDAELLASWGADEVVHLEGDNVEEDVAHAFAEWAAEHRPWAVLTESTAWGREVAARAAARLGAGLTGDAVGLELEGDRLVAWKPAFGGQLVAAVSATSPIQMATVRAGMLDTLTPRSVSPVRVTTITMARRGRVTVTARTRDDDIEVLADARVVIAVGMGVSPAEYPMLEPLRGALHAELGATRKVTDKGWMPRARQIGITGRTIAPRLVVSIGASGKFNHTVGLRAAGTVLAINPDPNALIFDAADVGIVGDWHDVLPLLVDALQRG
ncbi:MAG: FAD-binding protein [Actinomycetota bacterium]|nr:FAD-binding protein [Actinomycetota bacterium]